MKQENSIIRITTCDPEYLFALTLGLTTSPSLYVSPKKVEMFYTLLQRYTDPTFVAAYKKLREVDIIPCLFALANKSYVLFTTTKIKGRKKDGKGRKAGFFYTLDPEYKKVMEITVKNDMTWIEAEALMNVATLFQRTCLKGCKVNLKEKKKSIRRGIRERQQPGTDHFLFPGS
jgi:hypothetical protein